jgi:dihydroneopterin aldolase
MENRDLISLNQMVFYAYHGVYDSEKELGQRFIINFSAELDYNQAAINDDLQLTVNYGEIYTIIEEVFQGKKYNLLESAAYNIIKQLFFNFSSLEFIEIEIIKPSVPIKGVLADASIKISRKRNEVI